MPQDSPSYEAVCLYVGRLFLESQHRLAQLSGPDNPVLQALREQLAAEQRKSARLERELSEARSA